MKWSTVINLACLGLMTSVVMDSYLWVTGRHWIPSWTMAAMSAGMIMVLQVLRTHMKGGE